MSELQGILEEEEGGGDGNPGVSRVTLQEITAAAKVRSRLRNHQHRKKMQRKRLSGFERRFSQLAVLNSLVQERKRIDYVLIHEDKLSGHGEGEDKEVKESVRRQELDRAKFTKLLRKEGFTIQTSHIGKNVYTKLFCPFKRLCREAERVKFEMPLKDCPKLDSGSDSCFSRFLEKHFETDDQEDFISTGFVMNKIEKFEGHENPNQFFRPAVRSFLTHHILINLNIDQLDDDLNEIEEDSKSPVKKRGEEEQPPPVKRRGLPYMLMKGNYTDSFVLHEESERSSIRGDNFLTASDIHDRLLDDDPRKELDMTWPRPFKFQPLWKIRNYFGERIAFYFAWSGMLCTSLWIPSIFGLCVFLYGVYVSATTDEESPRPVNQTSFVDTVRDLFGDFKQSFDNDITPYFGLTICVWGTVFLEIWKRKNAELAYEWDVEQFEANEPDRPSFSGTKSKRDPVTDEWVWYYPFRRQCFKFCFSFSILLMMICLVLISVTAIIIYRVIINIDYCPGMTAAECILVTTVMSSILNAVSILLLTRVYNVLARWLTEWENHRTQTKFNDALIFKLFAFQFVNSYASCFYIAFFRGRFESIGFLGDSYNDSCEGSCMTQLSVQVLVLMVVKPLPKFFKDIILVWVRKTWHRNPDCCKCLRKLPCFTTNQVTDIDMEAKVGDGKNWERHKRHLKFLRHERLKPNLGDFTLDEYTEKIIQYGFLMLFATSFPLAPLLALLTNMFDLRVDAKRLLWWYRRPIADVAQDIGMWFEILLFVNFCGVVSNAFLIAFTSTWGAKYTTTQKLIIVIAFEHIVFALKYVVAYLIPDTPSHVQLSIRREQYQIQKKMEEPRKDTDYAHLFPVDEHEESHEDDTDGMAMSSRRPGGGHASPALRPRSRRPPDTDSNITYLNATRKAAESVQAAGAKASSGLDEDSCGGYVEGSDLEVSQRLNPRGDLWYCGQKSDSKTSAGKRSNSSGKVEAEARWSPNETDLFSSRISHASASDVKPQGKKLLEDVDRMEGTELPGREVHTPVYTSTANPTGGHFSLFSSPRQRPLSAHSNTEC